MKFNFEDEYYNQIYEIVDELEFMEYVHLLPKLDENGEAYAHMHMEINDADGKTIRIDKNGLMINCQCGCLQMMEVDFFTVCQVQQDLDKIIESTKNPPRTRKGEYWSKSKEEYQADFREFVDKSLDEGRSMERLFEDFENISANAKENNIRRTLRRVERTIDRLIDDITELKPDLREEYLEKLKDVLGKSE